MIGIIGGTALESLNGKEVKEIRTDYGVVHSTLGKIGNIPVIFIPRHGPNHEFPPHKVNHHANISALYQLKIKKVIGVSLVGSIIREISPGSTILGASPGSIVIPHQEVDFTGRPWTFFNGGEKGIKHSDMTEPFCPRIRASLKETASKIEIKGVVDGGTYVCVVGPQFETKAEIDFFDRMGGDIVGMTTAPEAKLCRERSICYASICPVSNLAAGRGSGKITHERNKGIAKQMEQRLTALIQHALPKINSLGKCDNCQG